MKIGKIIMIKSWESMEKEHGLTKTGSINTKIPFLREMRIHCNRKGIVTKVTEHGVYLRFCGCTSPWLFTTEMLCI